MRFDLTPFDMSSIKPGSVIYIIGKRGSGKTTLLQDIMYTLRHQWDYGIAMSETYDVIEFFKSCMPDAFVYEDSYDEAKAAEFVETAMATMKDRGEDQTPNSLLVLDDCMYDKKIVQSKFMRKLHMNGRHAKITFINTMQYVMGIPPETRSQVDYVFAMGEDAKDTKEKLHKYFFGVFETYKDFEKVFNKATENFGCLVIKRTKAKSQNLEDKIFWYKAPEVVPPFKLFRTVYWQLAQKYAIKTDAKKSSDTKTKAQGDPRNPKIEFVGRAPMKAPEFSRPPVNLWGSPQVPRGPAQYGSPVPYGSPVVKFI